MHSKSNNATCSDPETCMYCIPLSAGFILLYLHYDTRVKKIEWSCNENTNTAKLEHNEHEYSKFTSITNSYSRTVLI